MSILTNNTYFVLFVSSFSVIFLIEMAYFIYVFERKIGALEHRLRTTEQSLSECKAKVENLTRELRDTRTEIVSNQCYQLAKNRVLRREFRILRHQVYSTLSHNEEQ